MRGGGHAGGHAGRAALRGVALAAVCAASFGGATPAAAAAAAADPAAFSVSSTSLAEGGTVGAAQLFDQGGCHGGNRSPQLAWRNPPAGTQSFAISIFDPDAPGRGWWHWFVAGIAAHTHALPENASASGLLGRLGAAEASNDYGTPGYGGPCPPPGKPHHYVITVYALRSADTHASAASAGAAALERDIAPDTLAKASLTVTYGR